MQITSGTIKATVGGALLAPIGTLSAGATSMLEPARLLALIVLDVLVSIAFMAMTSCIVARLNSSIMPRVVFGMRCCSPDAGIAGLVTDDRSGGSVYVCGAYASGVVVEGGCGLRALARFAVSGGVCGGDGCGGVVSADVVRLGRPSSRRSG